MDPIHDSDHGLKVTILGRRRAGTTLAEHRQHIRHVHGERVLKYIATDPTHAPRGYIQHRVFDQCFSTGALGQDPLALAWDLVTQVFFDDVQALMRSHETDFYRNELQEDEARFVDQKTVLVLAARSQTVLDGDLPKGACKLFVMQRKPGRLPTAHEGVCRHVRNAIVPMPGAAPQIAAMDEFWFCDEEAARAGLGLMRHQACLDEAHSAVLLAWEERLA